MVIIVFFLLLVQQISLSERRNRSWTYQPPTLYKNWIVSYFTRQNYLISNPESIDMLERGRAQKRRSIYIQHQLITPGFGLSGSPLSTYENSILEIQNRPCPTNCQENSTKKTTNNYLTRGL